MPEAKPDLTPAVQPEASPTGTAVIPPKYVPHALAVLSVLGAVAAAPTMGLSFIPAGVAGGALLLSVILGSLLGVASPGLRKK